MLQVGTVEEVVEYRRLGRLSLYVVEYGDPEVTAGKGEVGPATFLIAAVGVHSFLYAG